MKQPETFESGWHRMEVRKWAEYPHLTYYHDGLAFAVDFKEEELAWMLEKLREAKET